VALLLDRPAWPAHGRLWSHLVSDTSIEELHAFARRVGVPSRSFEGDHYDVPAERYAELVAAGARPVEGRELVRALLASGLRLPKRKGERVLDSWPAVRWPGHPVPCRVDCLVSPLQPPSATTVGTVLLALDDGRLLLDGSVDALPAPDALPAGDRGRPCGYLRARFSRADGDGGVAGSGTGGGGREHVAALRPLRKAEVRPLADADVQLLRDAAVRPLRHADARPLRDTDVRPRGRWLPVDQAVRLPALRWWAPLVVPLADHPLP
jgi:hypothetical protein